MDFRPGDQFTIRVKPKSRRNEIVFQGDLMVVYVNAAPEDGKANLAVVKLFKSQLDVRIEITHGFLSATKRIRIL